MSYDEIKTEIKNAPLTWLPGLLVCVVKTSLEKKVFKPGGAARIAKEVEDEKNETATAMPNAELSEPPTRGELPAWSQEFFDH